MNFALAPHRIPTLEMAAAVEGVARGMNELEASELRVSVCSVLKRSKLPLSNIIKAESVVVSFFVILPEDKGNATVVMDSSADEGKLRKLLNYNVYRKVKKDPTPASEREVLREVRLLEQEELVSTELGK